MPSDQACRLPPVRLSIHDAYQGEKDEYYREIAIIVAKNEEPRKSIPALVRENCQGNYVARASPPVYAEVSGQDARATGRAVLYSGFTGSPLRRTSKCRCGPVASPVAPT